MGTKLQKDEAVRRSRVIGIAKSMKMPYETKDELMCIILEQHKLLSDKEIIVAGADSRVARMQQDLMTERQQHEGTKRTLAKVIRALKALLPVINMVPDNAREPIESSNMISNLKHL